MTPFLILAVVALILAVASMAFPNFHLTAVAVILLAVALLISRG